MKFRGGSENNGGTSKEQKTKSVVDSTKFKQESGPAMEETGIVQQSTEEVDAIAIEEIDYEANISANPDVMDIDELTDEQIEIVLNYLI